MTMSEDSLTWLVARFVASVVLISGVVARDADLGRNFTQLVASRGFHAEVHHFRTEDDYIIGLFRVGCRHKCVREKVVYLSTPLFMDADSFVSNYANNSLAFLLADAGYDVWIGNCRGTKYSRKAGFASSPSSLDVKFFDYTFIDIGLKDIPAGIDYVLRATGIEKLFYFGHSQATAGFFALLSARPEYNDKVRAMVAMAPFRRLKCNVGQDEQLGALAWIAHHHQALQGLRCTLGEFPPRFMPIGGLCRIMTGMCGFGLHIFLGPTPNLNQSRIDVIMQQVPAATSLKNLVFLAQMSLRDCLNDEEVYDYDYETDSCGGLFDLFSKPRRNEKHYGTARPRVFHARDIRVPVKLYFAENDGYASPTEVRRLERELPDCRGTFKLDGVNGHYDLIVPTYNASHIYDAIEFMDGFVDGH